MKNQVTKITNNIEMTIKEGKLHVKSPIKNSFINSNGNCFLSFNAKGEMNGIRCGFTAKLKNPVTHKPLGYISKTMAEIIETYPDDFNDFMVAHYELMKKDFPNLEDEDDSDVLEDEE